MFRAHLGISLFCFMACSSTADEVLYRYEGDVLPYDESAGWLVYNACDQFCTQSLEHGHFVLRWSEYRDIVNCSYWIAEPPQPAPSSLWVEWRFRSNQLKPSQFYSGDGRFSIKYKRVAEVVNLFGDTAAKPRYSILYGSRGDLRPVP